MPRSSAATARVRLLGDRAALPVQDARVRLAVLSARLDRAARRAITDHLSARVRTEARFGPLLGQLIRQSLAS